MRHALGSWLVVFALVVLVGEVGRVQSDRFVGYTTASTVAERDWERRFRALPDPQLMREAMKRLTARPHHVGSPYDKDNADWMLARLREWGLDARIESFDVLFPTPKERLVEMVEPTRFTLRLDEPVVAVDPTSDQKSEQLPTYNAYSIDGDVTGELVYVNQGMPDDYLHLERAGVSVKGRIVIARYGGGWRGLSDSGESAWQGAEDAALHHGPRPGRRAWPCLLAKSLRERAALHALPLQEP